MASRTVTATILSLSLIASAGVISACDSSEPDNTIRIGVDRRSTQAVVIAEMYRQSLERGGSPATLQALVIGAEDTPAEVQKQGVRLLEQEQIDVLIGCTGTLLRVEAPRLAAELSEEYTSEDSELSEVEWIDKTYSAMMSQLRRGVDASNPSMVAGCNEDAETPLPESLVPLYRKTVIDRNDRIKLNDISGGITADELESLIDEVRREGDTTHLVSVYLDSLG
ncbi:MAG: hypothetical protein Q3976_01055 [Corynebacterium sp.]|nr:hypothetical protein [Corynebacterium sp.]